MLVKISLISSFLIAQAVFAGQGDIDKVVKLANTVKSVASTSQASDQALQEAAAKLREVIELLSEDAGNGSGGNGNSPGSSDFTACYDFAYQKYYASLSSSSAADKATLACKAGAELEVLKFLYEKHYSSLSSLAAMDKAVLGANRKTHGKLEIIKFMYEKYYSSLSASAAATKAADGAMRVRKNGLECIKKVYPNYYASQSATAAMDSAVNACSVN